MKIAVSVATPLIAHSTGATLAAIFSSGGSRGVHVVVTP
jgi:hypothetical protein